MEGRITNFVQTIDQRFNTFTDKNQFPLAIQSLESLTTLGSVQINLILLLLLTSFGKTVILEKMAIGLAATWTVIYVLKEFVKRSRPEVKISHIMSRASFPSGHSGTAFLTATVLSTYINREAFFFTLATTVAFSRVYLEDHYLSDALIGSLIGLSIGLGLTTL